MQTYVTLVNAVACSVVAQQYSNTTMLTPPTHMGITNSTRRGSERRITNIGSICSKPVYTVWGRQNLLWQNRNLVREREEVAALGKKIVA